MGGVMASLVFLLLPLSVLFVFGVFIVAFGDVAFRQVAVASRADQRSAVLPARSPFVDVVATMQRLSSASTAPALSATRECESHIPTVTDVEAKAIVEELRRSEKGDLNLVMEQSRRHGTSCPMLMKTGLCACSIARPLACIGRCGLGGDSPEWVAGLGDSLSDAFRHHLESRHVPVKSSRLDDALVSLMDGPQSKQ
jgi:hypothetical protein